MVKLKIKKIDKSVEDNTYANPGDAGIDLRASGKFVIGLDSDKKEISSEEYTIEPSERILVKTSIEMEIPAGYFGSIRDRSGLAMKNGLHCLAGVIDETYRGEVGVVLVNTSKKPYVIKKNDRIAQIIIQPYVRADVEFVDSLEDSKRGIGGFGSSGRN